jgi:hypothetical protein
VKTLIIGVRSLDDLAAAIAVVSLISQGPQCMFFGRNCHKSVESCPGMGGCTLAQNLLRGLV